MTRAILITTCVLVCAIVSSRMYDHKNHVYREGKAIQIPSDRSFGLVQHYLRISSTLITICAAWFSFDFLLIAHRNLWITLAGLLLAGIGLLLFIWAKRVLGQCYSPCFDSFVPDKIVTNGPYKYVRHPIYTANILTMMGFWIACGSGWLLANTIILFWYYRRSAIAEEKSLSVHVTGYDLYLMNAGRFLPKMLSR